MTELALTVLKPGVQTTVQDLGRHGLRHSGIGGAGALCPHSLTLANTLLGQDVQAAGLEVLGGPLAVRFEHDLPFALVGADFDAQLDGHPVAVGWRHDARAGQVLRVDGPRHGRVLYIAIAGGVEVPRMLGARSTDLTAGFGGWQGRALQAGDALPMAPTLNVRPGRRPRRGLPPFQPVTVLRALPGPEHDAFSPDDQALFWEGTWRLHPRSNRMGSRLEGPLLRANDAPDAWGDLLSQGVWPGVVQVPPDGQPIVLMAEAQTTGGYPRIAVVIEADRPALAQLQVGQSFRWARVTQDDALAARRRALADTAWARSQLAPAAPVEALTPKRDHLTDDEPPCTPST